MYVFGIMIIFENNMQHCFICEVASNNSVSCLMVWLKYLDAYEMLCTGAKYMMQSM